MEKLNPQQIEAVQHVHGPLLVLAGAGSGKTRVVTHRIAHLLEMGVSPGEILAVTFTNKAADEMRHRIEQLRHVRVLASTFHSLGARILRESIGELGYGSSFTIYDEEDSGKLLKQCLESFELPDEKGVVKGIRHQISAAKNGLIDPEGAGEVEGVPFFPKIYRLYQERMKHCNAVDFDDLLYLTVKLLQRSERARREYQNRWLFVLIDEYQDTNFAQYTLTKLLVEQHKNLFAVGDPDQSIYSWRGARYQNILNFANDFPGAKVILLEENYRSTDLILRAANALIEHNSLRYEKRLWSRIGGGEKIGLYRAYDEREEALFVVRKLMEQHDRGVSLKEMAIFYRTNAQSRPFEDALLRMRIPYEIVGGVSFYERREVKDLLGFLRMVVSDSDVISFLRTVQIPKRGLGGGTVEKIVMMAQERGAPIFSFCEEVLRGEAPIKLTKRQGEGLREYVGLVRELREMKGRPIYEVLEAVVRLTRYTGYLEADPETVQDRKENVQELIGKAAEWEEEAEEPSLAKFLEELSLRSNVEKEEGVSTVKLMTLHNSKGLEFTTVFLVGLEEDLLPHINSKESEEAVEEERRLCYVGMTRARRNLYLSSALSRFQWGGFRTMRPSRFIQEIPESFLTPLGRRGAS